MSAGQRIGAGGRAMAGAVAVVAIWWLLADTVLSNVGAASADGGGSIPDPARVVSTAIEDGFSFYAPNVSLTLREAFIGYVGGNLIAIGLAAAVMVVRQLEGVVSQLAVISYCIPIVAIGPILRILIDPPQSGEVAGTAVFLAGLLVFFTTVVGALLGLKAADKATLELVAAYGGSRWQQLTKVRIIAAIPSVLTALKVAAPSAFLGAVLGEYLGGVDVGVGPALINAQQTLQIPRTWGLALVAGLVSLAGYLIVALIGRFAAPWAAGTKELR
ncbi:ABC-type nitrate/sulfonate/bicarbonate transport system permease component [Actinoplanes lutulentus]|uniref:ABC-type nitrate/sulfonate/bicarbonate transport system permease component n=1 Tax=Actinoplanes lutulentus TaxID=1287878 RepID=A0A327YY45_9ACTN|nr:ABC transporter permease subunit [Actinoplanes lutulentus]MBB2946512.1 ABC-type nitrate/sulfonate/bicarbonate transport system permease component [Actinoplanes lutulentus]RAK26430.1 ABC-type nitrate/sulfonate/bicarbonate transport system permease component [Actinoplanes lutulentus]